MDGLLFAALDLQVLLHLFLVVFQHAYDPGVIGQTVDVEQTNFKPGHFAEETYADDALGACFCAQQVFICLTVGAIALFAEGIRSRKRGWADGRQGECAAAMGEARTVQR